MNDERVVPLWPDDEAWTLAEIMAALAVCHVGEDVSMRVLRLLRGLRRGL